MKYTYLDMAEAIKEHENDVAFWWDMLVEQGSYHDSLASLELAVHLSNTDDVAVLILSLLSHYQHTKEGVRELVK